MIETSTPNLDITDNIAKLERPKSQELMSEPAPKTIENILNFSKNLEVLKSENLKFIEIIKT